MLPVRLSPCSLDVEDKDGICSTTGVVNQIKLITGADSPAQAIDDIKKKTKCGTELCAVKTLSREGKISESEATISIKRMKQPGPSKSTKLLNNDNIDKVLDSLSSVHKGLYHMKFQMIDFAGTRVLPPTELGKIDMVKDVIDKGYKKFCVVMNTDVRTGEGIHWFSIFADFTTSPMTLEYFNSSGNRPMRQMHEWLVKTHAHISKSHKCDLVVHSGLIHQVDSETECGPYSIYYIWRRLNGAPLDEFSKNRIPDSAMIEFRKHLFA